LKEGKCEAFAQASGGQKVPVEREGGNKWRRRKRIEDHLPKKKDLQTEKGIRQGRVKRKKGGRAQKSIQIQKGTVLTSRKLKTAKTHPMFERRRGKR